MGPLLRWLGCGRGPGLSWGGRLRLAPGLDTTWVRSRVRARLAVLSVLVGRLDCEDSEEARGQEDKNCGSHRSRQGDFVVLLGIN